MRMCIPYVRQVESLYKKEGSYFVEEARLFVIGPREVRVEGYIDENDIKSSKAEYCIIKQSLS